MSGLLVATGTSEYLVQLPVACMSGLLVAKGAQLTQPIAKNLYARIARRQGHQRVPSPTASSLCVKLARRQGYLKILTTTNNSLYVRNVRRQGYLKVPSPSANNLYVGIARRLGYQGYLAKLPTAWISELIIARQRCYRA